MLLLPLKQFRQIYAIAFLFSSSWWLRLAFDLAELLLFGPSPSIKWKCVWKTHKWKAHYLIWFILICRELVWRAKKIMTSNGTNFATFSLKQFVVCVCLCRVFFLSSKQQNKKPCNVDAKKKNRFKWETSYFLVLNPTMCESTGSIWKLLGLNSVLRSAYAYIYYAAIIDNCMKFTQNCASETLLICLHDFISLMLISIFSWHVFYSRFLVVAVSPLSPHTLNHFHSSETISWFWFN